MGKNQSKTKTGDTDRISVGIGDTNRIKRFGSCPQFPVPNLKRHVLAILHPDPDARLRAQKLDRAHEGPVALRPRPVELAGVDGHTDAEPLARQDLADGLLHGIELPVAVSLRLLQVEDREEERPEDDVVGVVEPPVEKLEAALGLQPVEELRAGERRQYQELRRGQPGPHGEPERLLDGRPVVLVEPQDEHAVDLDVVFAQDAGRLHEIGHGLLLLHPGQAPRVDGFEADVHRVAAGLSHEADELEVAGDVGPDLGGPFQIEVGRDHRLEQILRVFPVGGEVVVVEKDGGAARVPTELAQDILRRAEAVLLAEHPRHRAERAVEGAAARRLDGNRRLEAPAPGVRLEEREVGVRDHVQVLLRLPQRVVDGAAVDHERQVGDGGRARAAFPGVDKVSEGPLPFAAEDVIGVLQGFVGQESHVRAAHEDGDLHLPDAVGDGVGPRGRRGDRRDADEVGRGDRLVVDPAQVLHVDLDLPAARLHHRPQDEHAQPRQGELGKDVNVRGLRLYENDLRHRLLLA